MSYMLTSKIKSHTDDVQDADTAKRTTQWVRVDVRLTLVVELEQRRSIAPVHGVHVTLFGAHAHQTLALT